MLYSNTILKILIFNDSFFVARRVYTVNVNQDNNIWLISVENSRYFLADIRLKIDDRMKFTGFSDNLKEACEQSS